MKLSIVQSILEEYLQEWKERKPKDKYNGILLSASQVEEILKSIKRFRKKKSKKP